MALRRMVKTALAAGLRWTGASSVIETINATKHIPLVIGYHSVVEDIRMHQGRAILPNLVSCRMLERQLDWLGQHFRFLTLDELGERFESGDPFNEPLAAITFDDGYAGVYHHALPLLQRKGIPAGVFLVTETLGRQHLQVYDKLFLLLARVLPMIDHDAERFATLCESHDVPLARQQGLKDVIKDPFDTMRLLFTTLTQKQLRRAIEALETVVKIRDEVFSRASLVDVGHGARAGSGRHDHRLAHADPCVADARESEARGQSDLGLFADVAGKARQARVAFCLSGRTLQSFRRVLCRRGRLPVRIHHLSASGRALPVADNSAENLVGEFLTRSVRGILEHPHALSRPLDLRSLPPLPAGP